MAHLLFVLLGLTHLVSGSSATSSCPASDGTTRSVWSILGSCALTLLICVWHALHPDVPKPKSKSYQVLSKRVGFVLLSFFAPELVVARAGQEWCSAHAKVRDFQENGYEWSMAHSYFAQMDGFLYRDENGGTSTIDADKLLELCKEGKISNPLITEKEIRGWSKSDAVGKAIFTVQLVWFTLQVIVRGSKGLAVTLVELDTVCMAVLAVVYLIFWWDKPLRPDCPHVFWYAGEKKVYSQTELSNAWKAEPGFWKSLIDHSVCIRKAQSTADGDKVSPDNAPGPPKQKAMRNLKANEVYTISLFITWLILGALHLIAWNFEFPSETEKKTWRVASLILAGSSPAMIVVAMLGAAADGANMARLKNAAFGAFAFVCLSGVVSRALLVGLMLAGLRTLPCSAHDTVSWTAYIPHL